MRLTGLVIFAITYALVSARRLSWLGIDRPAAALIGAVLCVVARELTPKEAFQAIDGETILLLFSVMGMGAFLAQDGFLDRIEGPLVRWARTPARLAGAIVWGSGLASALITNDAACVLAAPLVVRIVQRHRLPAAPFLLALATGTNTGSVATLVGNPQNMLCGSLGHLTFRGFLWHMTPVALAGLAINHAVLVLLHRRALSGASFAPEEPAEACRPPWLPLAVIAGSAVAYTLGTDLAWTATTGFALLLLLTRSDSRQIWPRIDFSILLFFAGLFVAVAGLEKSGAPAWLFARWPLADPTDGPGAGLSLTGLFLVGSNVVSNVPFILVVRDQLATTRDPRLAWELLAMASTFAGNLTLLGSVANVIVAENGRSVGGLGFREHLRTGAPIALLTTLAGAAWLLAAAR